MCKATANNTSARPHQPRRDPPRRTAPGGPAPHRLSCYTLCHDHSVTDAFRWANEGLAFLLELAVPGALCYWGFQSGRGMPVKLVLGIGAPLLAVLVWGLFAAPDATFAVPLAGVLAVKALVFGAATVALYAFVHRRLAIAYGLLALANTIIVTIIRDSNAG